MYCLSINQHGAAMSSHLIKQQSQEMTAEMREAGLPI